MLVRKCLLIVSFCMFVLCSCESQPKNSQSLNAKTGKWTEAKPTTAPPPRTTNDAYQKLTTKSLVGDYANLDVSINFGVGVSPGGIQFAGYAQQSQSDGEILDMIYAQSIKTLKQDTEATPMDRALFAICIIRNELRRVEIDPSKLRPQISQLIDWVVEASAPKYRFISSSKQQREFEERRVRYLGIAVAFAEAIGDADLALKAVKSVIPIIAHDIELFKKFAGSFFHPIRKIDNPDVHNRVFVAVKEWLISSKVMTMAQLQVLNFAHVYTLVIRELPEDALAALPKEYDSTMEFGQSFGVNSERTYREFSELAQRIITLVALTEESEIRQGYMDFMFDVIEMSSSRPSPRGQANILELVADFAFITLALNSTEIDLKELEASKKISTYFTYEKILALMHLSNNLFISDDDRPHFDKTIILLTVKSGLSLYGAGFERLGIDCLRAANTYINVHSASKDNTKRSNWASASRMISKIINAMGESSENSDLSVAFQDILNSTPITSDVALQHELDYGQMVALIACSSDNSEELCDVTSKWVNNWLNQYVVQSQVPSETLEFLITLHCDSVTTIAEDRELEQDAYAIRAQVQSLREGSSGNISNDTLHVWDRIPNNYKESGRFAEADREYAAMLEEMQDTDRVQSDSWVVWALWNRAVCQYKRGNHADSEKHFRELLTRGPQYQRWEGAPVIEDIYLNFGRSMQEQGDSRFAEAEQKYLAALEVCDMKYVNSDKKTVEVVEQLVDLYDRWNKPQLEMQYSERLPNKDTLITDVVE